MTTVQPAAFLKPEYKLHKLTCSDSGSALILQLQQSK